VYNRFYKAVISSGELITTERLTAKFGEDIEGSPARTPPAELQPTYEIS